MLGVAAAGLAMTVAACSASGSAGDSEVELRVAHGFLEGSVEQQVLEETADRISERTDGAVELSIFPANSTLR